MMQVYHGGLAEIFEIDLSKSQPNKDFSLLSDKETGLYAKPWKDIYKELLNELSSKQSTT